MLDATAGKSRRELLRSVAMATAAVPVLAACDLLNPKPQGPPPPDPLADFYADTLTLVALYETADAQFAPIRDAHRAHAAALAAIMKPMPSAAPSAFPTPGKDLRAAEQKGHQTAVDACLAAPANRVTLLGEIAAARACHLEVLP